MGFWRRGNYEANTIEMITNHIRWWAMFQSGTWYVGLTANPVQSLEAHHISIYEKNFFHCWDIPQKDGISHKKMGSPAKKRFWLWRAINGWQMPKATI